ncbi:ribbon-helix-helix domain-containing protein [Oricola thermophila]|uniref:Ribbon-helix-helix domain-containing protein n=1 Tax=Oricola thermophila TaxID=2742145 RepID=A0A6N1VDD9_9HYPH|nr:ribbon-helix-helix domain-containing protein [Oricola thermophila]QKV17252.1 ribbon-helix-helix domain-containing protein [Oricola thermophila]
MAVRKHSVTISGHRTSFSIEDEFHARLKESAARKGISLAALVAAIDKAKPRDSNLSSALRVHVLNEALSGRAASSH